MADANYPLPGFHFSVDFGGTIINCNEVSGLDMEVEVIEYRAGDDQTFSTQKMSGLKKTGDVSVKKGIFAGDQEYYAWFNEVSMNTPSRKDVIISLLDESHSPVMTWKLLEISTIFGMTLVAIETIEIAHEGLTIE